MLVAGDDNGDIGDAAIRHRPLHAAQPAADDTGEALSTADARLFAALKAMRLALAREKKVPAYVVMTDRSMREVALARPRDATALGRVHGIGPAKVETYGAAVLAVVAKHAE